jgi:hypothetical protein
MAINSIETAETGIAMLRAMRERGVTLHVTDGQLRYRGPPGALTEDDLARLRSLKDELIRLLGTGLVLEKPELQARRSTDYVPLTFTQEWWWHLAAPLGSFNGVRYWEMRTCADAVRIFGALDAGCLRSSLTALTNRHESLRTIVAIADGVPIQKIFPPTEFDLEIIDLTKISRTNVEAEAKRLVDEIVYGPADAVFGARLVKLTQEDHVFVAAMGHLIADGASVEIMSRDLGVLYSSLSGGISAPLPALPVQYPDYAVWQRKASEWWVAEHASYWTGRFGDAMRVAFPSAPRSRPAKGFQFTCMPIQLNARQVKVLRELARRGRTTLPMVVLAVYSVLILRWQEKWDLVIRFLISGRDRPELQNLIGFLATLLHFRIQLSPSDTFMDLLAQVTLEYRRAHEHYDFGRISAIRPRPDYARSTAINWIPMSTSDGASAILGGQPTWSDLLHRVEQYPFTPYTEMGFSYDAEGLDDDPYLAVQELENTLTVLMMYRSDLFDAAEMERFGRNLILLTDEISATPHTCVTALQYR